MPSLTPDSPQLKYDESTMLYSDSVGNLYEYSQGDFGGELRAVATTNSSDPFDIKANNFDKVIDQVSPGFVQMIKQTQLPGESWIDTAQKLLTAVTMTAQQSQLMQLNIERAKKGLPPVDITAFTGVGVNIGLSPGTKDLLIYGGIALVAVFFLTRSR